MQHSLFERIVQLLLYARFAAVERRLWRRNIHHVDKRRFASRPCSCHCDAVHHEYRLSAHRRRHGLWQYAYMALDDSGPDMRLRPIHFMIRNKKYLLAYTVKLFEDFSSGNIKEIYDLQSDPLETKDLAKSNQYDKEEISFLLTQLKERHCEILKSYLKHKKYKNECV